MTQPDQLGNVHLEAREGGAVDDIQRLGQIGLTEGAHDVQATPEIDIEVNGIEPSHFAPAGAKPYLGSAKKGPDIIQYQDDPEEGRKAAEYARGIFPSSEFTYLGGGRYGVVLADETGKAFKVYRSASVAYSRYEKEAGALQALSNAGITPKLHLFVDAGNEYRLDRKAYDYTTFGFEDVQIPRQNSGKELPVMVMDRVDVAPLESAEPSKLVEGFCKAADIFIKENIRSWDTEVMVDRITGNIVILDVGELSQIPFDEATATPQTKLTHDLEILRNVAMDFALSKYEYRLQDAYKAGGIEAVRDLLTQLIQTA